MGHRRPTPDESRLLRELATIAGMEQPDEWIETLRVKDMNDGGMGSLDLAAPELTPERGRKLVVRNAAVQFADADGVEVIASLNARQDGVPFELDVWKTDFSKLIRISSCLRRLEE